MLKDNPNWATQAKRPQLNQFMAQLIFCFFAEDTDIFQGSYPLASQPDPLADLIRTHNVVQMPVRQRSSRPRWLQAAALAACLVAGVALGRLWQDRQFDHSSGGTLVASGPLAGALETQLASTAGDTRMLVSFRNKNGDLCRVFEGQAIKGIACKNSDRWQLLSTQSTGKQSDTAYRQAGSANSALMSEAQDMMAGNPFSEADEKRARALGWSLKTSLTGNRLKS